MPILLRPHLSPSTLIYYYKEMSSFLPAMGSYKLPHVGNVLEEVSLQVNTECVARLVVVGAGKGHS